MFFYCSGNYTNPLSLANFVGIVVGFSNVCTIRLRRLLRAASLSFESEMVLVVLTYIGLNRQCLIKFCLDYC
jgi:hypothetical protein